MFKINYPEDLNKFKSEYLSIFSSSLQVMQSEWDEIRRGLIHQGAEAVYYPQNVSELLIMTYEGLCEIYLDFESLNLAAVNNQLLIRCRQLFNYNGITGKVGAKISGKQASIAEFFMKHSDVLNIRTCFYCNLSYVNVYKTSGVNKNHFDIDHFLPKSICPLVALSLFNFVPSCQVCNEKLKKEKLMGEAVNLKKVSPTSSSYKFDESIKFDVASANPFSINNKEISISLKGDALYSKEIEILKLEERYNYHKCEVERLLSLIQKYPESNINMIGQTLKISENTILNDIFGIEFLKSNDRCFKKIKTEIFDKYYKKT